MKHPIEVKSYRKPHEGEKNISDTVEYPVILDMAVVEQFGECTFDNKNFTKGTFVEMDRYGMNISTPYEDFKKAMQEAGLLNNLKTIK